MAELPKCPSCGDCTTTIPCIDCRVIEAAQAANQRLIPDRNWQTCTCTFCHLRRTLIEYDERLR